jgi:hypothetical protein
MLHRTIQRSLNHDVCLPPKCGDQSINRKGNLGLVRSSWTISCGYVFLPLHVVTIVARNAEPHRKCV